MKKTGVLLILVSLVVSSFSQISMTSTDMPTSGWTQRVIMDSLPLPAVNYGNKGANQTYDFSNLVTYKNDTIEYRAPTSAQLSACPAADVAITSDGSNFIFTKTASAQLTLEGFQGLINGNSLSASYSTPPVIYKFPTTYNSNFSGSSYLQKTVPGSQVGYPVFSQVRLTITSTFKDTLDGWGKVKTPVGSYKCLRNKRLETTNTLVEGYLFSWSTLSNTTANTTRYTYLTKEAKGSVVTFDYDSLNNLRSATYSLIPPAAPLANFTWSNPSGGLVQFTDATDGYPDTYSWNYGDGSTNGTTQNPNHTYAANGAYRVCLTVTNAGGSNVFCDSVHVTGIAAANNPPVAYNDTVSLLQGTSITIFHVATNDIDPDADNLCLDTVWGSPFVTEYIGGSCDMVSIHPDSTFVGTDTAWYRICDNGTPVLCDTGLIIFTVNANPALLPVSGFSKSAFNYANCTGALTTSTSLNATSLVWNFHPFNPVRPDSTYTSASVHYYGDMSSIISMNVQVCLTATNQFGNSTKCDTVDLSCVTSIDEIPLQKVRLYPNPAINKLTIDFHKAENEMADQKRGVEIYNALGHEVKISFPESSTSGILEISVSELPSGVYILRLIDAQGMRRPLGQFTKE